MNDQKFEQQLKDELRTRADRVRPSADAWARIQQQADTSRRRGGWLMGLGLVGAAGAAVAVGVNVLQGPESVIIEQEPAGPAAVTEAPTTGATETVPPAEEQTAPEDVTSARYATSRVALPGGGEFASAEGVAQVGDTVLVVGDGGEDGPPLSWVSRDGGRTFSELAAPSADAGEWRDVTAFEGRFLVAGQVEGQPAIQVYDPASEQWSPGWTTAGSTGTLYAITDGPSGPVATGNFSTPDGRSGLVVAMDEGARWNAITDVAGFLSSETVLYHATATDLGYVATGYGPDGGSIIDTWFSADGRSWEHLNATPGLGMLDGDGVIDTLVGDPDNGSFWAVQAGGAVWRSRDGREWTTVSRLPSGEDPMSFRGAASAIVDGDLLSVAGRDVQSLYRTDADRGLSEPLAEQAGQSLTIGAGMSVSDDGTVLVPLRDAEGLFVWRGEPA